jgi:hypothetical protein
VSRVTKKSIAARRSVEATVLVFLMTGFLGLQWYDDENHVRTNFKPPDRVTLVQPGAYGTLGHVAWQLLGRETDTPASLLSPGAAELTLDLETRPLDAQGVKEATGFSLVFRLGDAGGHVWTGVADIPAELAPGRSSRVKVTFIVPQDRLTGTVLELLSSIRGQGAVPVLRFAH